MVNFGGDLALGATLENSDGRRKLSLRHESGTTFRAFSIILDVFGSSLDALSISYFHEVKSMIWKDCQGSRLVSLEMNRCKVNTTSLLSIAASCPNVLIDLGSLPAYTSYTDTIIALGRFASSWTIYHEDISSPTVFHRVGLSCPNLRSVTVNVIHCLHFKATTLEGLFAEPKLQLRDVRVIHSGVHSATAISIALDVLSDKIDSLESFDFGNLLCLLASKTQAWRKLTADAH